MSPSFYGIYIKILVISLLLGISIVGSKISRKLGFPIILLFIIVGVVAKPFIQDYNTQQATYIANFLGIIALTFILFSGGLATKNAHIYPIWRPGILLSSLGTLLTALMTGGLLYYAAPVIRLTLSLKQSILVGSILASTDAAAVFSILKSRKIHLKAHLGPLLELESGSNDVMVFFLMLFLFHLIDHPDASLLEGIPLFFAEMVIGTLGGILSGIALGAIINKINLPYQALYAPLTIALIFLPFALVNLLHGSGYLAVYIAGIILGNRDFIHRKSIVKFYEGFEWLLQIAMFIALGLLVDMRTLINVAPLGLILSLLLMVVVRPFSVLIALFVSKFNTKQKMFIAWVGLRGAVPIVFATYLYDNPNLAGIADTLFHLIFFIVLVSVLVQGSSLHFLAKRLRLDAKRELAHRPKRHVLSDEEDVKKILVQLELPADSPAHNKAIVDLGLPPNTFIALAYRDKRYFPVRGSTVLQAQDKLFLVTNTNKELKETQTCLGIASTRL